MDEEYNLRVANLELKKSYIYSKYEQPKKFRQELDREKILKFVERLFSDDEFFEFINNYQKDEYIFEYVILSNNTKTFEKFKQELNCLLGPEFFDQFDLKFIEKSYDYKEHKYRHFMSIIKK